MANEDFWQSILNIIHQGFTQNGLSKLEEYAENFISQRLVYKRFSPSEQHGCIEGGTNHVIASILAGAEIEADKLSAPEGSFKREQQCGETQAERIEQWAKKTGCWIDNTDITIPKLLGEEIAQGGEAHVYDNGATLVKVIGLDYFVQPILALDRITLHNAYFPATRMIVLGFGRNKYGMFDIIVEQPFIQGSRMNDNEIAEYAVNLGYKLINSKNWTFATERIYLSDMHDENVIRSPKGNVFVVDCDIRINTPDLRVGGTQILTNEIEWDSSFN